jgi:hypothetical protein
MMQRIKRQTTHVFCRAIAAQIGSIRMSPLVAAKADEYRQHAVDRLVKERQRFRYHRLNQLGHKKRSFPLICKPITFLL